METQKIVNLLNNSENEHSKFATKTWYIIDSETKGSYSHHDPIRFLTGSLESSLCYYSDAYILVTGDIALKRRNAADTADIELHLKTVEQKSMRLLLIMQILLILQCQCTI